MGFGKPHAGGKNKSTHQKTNEQFGAFTTAAPARWIAASFFFFFRHSVLSLLTVPPPLVPSARAGLAYFLKRYFEEVLTLVVLKRFCTYIVFVVKFASTYSIYGQKAYIVYRNRKLIKSLPLNNINFSKSNKSAGKLNKPQIRRICFFKSNK